MKIRAVLKTAIYSLALSLIAFSGVSAQTDDVEIIDGDKMYNILPPDRIPAIFEPGFISVDEADNMMDDEELVLGIVVNGDARAYSTWHLEHHEIVNDVVGGVPVAVTW